MQKILIANRGEIAVRIIRAIREMGFKSVSIFSKADRASLHVSLADQAFFIGDAPAHDSYLNIEKIIQIASQANVDAIHPGYGFLAEDSHFIKTLEDVAIKFIGPSSEMVYFLGNKINAKKKANELNIPTLGGESEKAESVDDVKKFVKSSGYPIMLKAAGGGGGRGIRIIQNESEIEQAFLNAQNEAKKSFKDDTLYIENYLENARHIEVQILGDKFDNIIHLGDRECSLQRKRQKIVEEAPSLVSESLRKKICDDAVKLMKDVNYLGAGTVEFLLDKNNKHFFMEVNTRIQVEHPVSEMVTGVDVVKEQIRAALGEKLSYKQSDIKINGHAIEVRVNAEDPFDNFIPSVGEIEKLHLPGGAGVRVDSYVNPHEVITPHYDSLIAKIICHARNREEATAKMRTSLIETKIFGVKTTVPFLQSLIWDKHFIEGKIHTTFIDEFLKSQKSLKDFFKEHEEILVAILATVHHKRAFGRKKDTEKLKESTSSRWVMQGRASDMKGT